MNIRIFFDGQNWMFQSTALGYVASCSISGFIEIMKDHIKYKCFGRKAMLELAKSYGENEL